MKLDHLTFAVVIAAALACGCSATTSKGPQTASIPNVAGTTNLMSAELAGPAPRVGKAHSTLQGLQGVDESDAFDANANANANDDQSAPKEARRSDGSHRSGSFGMSSK